MLPPATPPFRSSTSQPGLFTSKDLMTEKHRSRDVNRSATKKAGAASQASGSFLTDEPGLGREVPHGHGNLFDDVFTDHLDVVLELGRDRNDGSSLSHGAWSGDITRHEGKVIKGTK